jgi:hypothetical protein
VVLEMRFLKVYALLLAVWLYGLQVWAESQHPTFIAAGFQFSQVEAICVMPVIDNRQGLEASAPLHLQKLRNRITQAVQQRGYAADPSCRARTPGGDPQTAGSRWLFTVTVDHLYVAGAVLTASLFDAQANSEAWRDTVATALGPRLANAERAGIGVRRDADGLVSGLLGRLLATVDKRKGKSK